MRELTCPSQNGGQLDARVAPGQRAGMTLAFLTQTMVSLIAIAALVALAAWARIARPAEPLDEARARALLAEEFPGQAVEALWIAADGRSVVARCGDDALVLYRLGDGYVARSLPWTDLVNARHIGAVRELRIKDVTAPRVRLSWNEGAAWPPLSEGAR